MPEAEAGLFTIGHSNRPLAEFLELLRASGIRLVVDVRTIPRSRHNPQFNADSLPDSLRGEGIGYLHLPGLGGLRKARADSPNQGWRNASFRGFADYMLTPEFRENLDRLIGLSRTSRIALMCAEAVPWRCHRSLIADALSARDIEVKHIISHSSIKRHAVTPWAVIRDGQVAYPGDAA